MTIFALMNAGRIEQDASPAELYVTPATAFAARFIGTPPMNILPAAAEGGWIGVPCGMPPLQRLSTVPISILLELRSEAEDPVGGSVEWVTRGQPCRASRPRGL